MNFRTSVILDVGQAQEHVITLDQDTLDAVRSVILGNLDAILARRIEAQVASLGDMPAGDGKPPGEQLQFQV